MYLRARHRAGGEVRGSATGYYARMPAAEWKVLFRIVVGWVVVMALASAVAVNVYSCSR